MSALYLIEIALGSSRSSSRGGKEDLVGIGQPKLVLAQLPFTLTVQPLELLELGVGDGRRHRGDAIHRVSASTRRSGSSGVTVTPGWRSIPVGSIPLTGALNLIHTPCSAVVAMVSPGRGETGAVDRRPSTTRTGR